MLARHLAVTVMSLVGTTYLLHQFRPGEWSGFAVAYLLLVSADILLSRSLIAALLRRDVAADPASVSSAARLVLYAGLALAVLLGAFPVAIEPLYTAPDFMLLMGATALCALLYAARAAPLTLLERSLRYRRVAISEVADMAAFYAIAVPAVAAGAGLEALAVATVVRGIVSFGIVRASARAPLIGSSARPAWRTLVPFGAPLCAAVGVTVIDALVPVIVIGHDERAVGFLVLASSVLGYGIAIVPVIQRVAMPSFGRLSGEQLTQAVRRSGALSALVTFSVMVPAGGLAEFWVEPLLGRTWRDIVPTLQLVALGQMPLGPVVVYNAALTSLGRSSTVLRLQTTTTIFYFVTAAILAVSVGSLGVAVAFAVSRWVWALLLAHKARQLLDSSPDGSTAFVVTSGLAGFAVILTAASQGALAAGLSTILAGALWLTLHRHLLRSSFRSATVRLARAET